MTRLRLAATLVLLLPVLGVAAACAAGTVPGAPTDPATGTATSAATSVGTVGTVDTVDTVDRSGLPTPRDVPTSQNGTVTVHVGERIHLVPPDSVNASLELSDFDQATFYGDGLTILGLRPGTQPISLPNFDKHFDCPNGPCAHPNLPIPMTLTVLPAAAPTAGTAAVPAIPVPVAVTQADNHRTIALKVGQRLTVPAGFSVVTGATASGATLEQSAGAGQHLVVGVRPGTDQVSVENFGANAAPRIDLTLTVSY